VGPHRSHPRRANLAKVQAFVDGDPEASFGLTSAARYSASEVLGFVAQLTGCSPDITDLASEDGLDPDLALGAIVKAAKRLAAEARRGAMLLAATGHPTGLLEHNLRLVDAFRKAGGKVLRLREEEKIPFGRGRTEVRYIGAVGCLAEGASLCHTHSSAPMETLLGSGPWPDIVLADHGFAGAAIERGIPTVAVMDINDCALAVAAAEGRDVIAIPMDDNRPPRLYEASWVLFERILTQA
jgi:hypothetical protein